MTRVRVCFDTEEDKAFPTYKSLKEVIESEGGDLLKVLCYEFFAKTLAGSLIDASTSIDSLLQTSESIGGRKIPFVAVGDLALCECCLEPSTVRKRVRRAAHAAPSSNIDEAVDLGDF